MEKTLVENMMFELTHALCLCYQTLVADIGSVLVCYVRIRSKLQYGLANIILQEAQIN